MYDDDKGCSVAELCP